MLFLALAKHEAEYDSWNCMLLLSLYLVLYAESLQPSAAIVFSSHQVSSRQIIRAITSSDPTHQAQHLDALI